jgi:hypothetical protein
MIEEGRRWDFPPSSWEVALCDELRKQPVFIIRRAPAAQLEWMRMPMNECHANVRWYVEHEPSKKARAVTGWWIQWPDFVLHSVVEIDGKLICVTPSSFAEPEFPFIPDTKIGWTEHGKVYSAIRDGYMIGRGVRAFPSFTMARNAIVRERLLAGVDPFTAIELTDEMMDELKREHNCTEWDGTGPLVRR